MVLETRVKYFFLFRFVSDCIIHTQRNYVLVKGSPNLFPESYSPIGFHSNPNLWYRFLIINVSWLVKLYPVSYKWGWSDIRIELIGLPAIKCMCITVHLHIGWLIEMTQSHMDRKQKWNNESARNYFQLFLVIRRAFNHLLHCGSAAHNLRILHWVD